MNTSGFGESDQAAMYLTYPLEGGFTVTDSQGVSPYSTTAPQTRPQLAFMQFSAIVS